MLSAPTSQPRSTILISLLILIVAMLAATGAFAQAMPDALTKPDPNDYSIAVLLTSIFGPGVGSWAMDGGVLKGMFSAFNLAVVAGGTIMFAYVSLVGTMATASDGELLGKKWSTMWVPLRFVGGVAMILPTASGLSLIQVAMMFVVAMGATFPTYVWNGFITGYASSMGNLTAISIPRQALLPIAEGILRAESCLAGLRRAAIEMPPEMEMINGIGVDTSVSKGAITLSWGQSATGPKFWISKDQCGKLTYAPGSAAAMNWGASRALAAGAQLTTSTGPTLSAPANSALAGAVAAAQNFDALAANGHIRGITAMWQALRPVGERLGTISQAMPSKDEINDAIEKSVDDYIKALLDAANGSSAKDVTDQITNGLQSKGKSWIFAGMYFYDIARLNDQVGRVMQKMPAISGMRDDNLPPEVQARIREIKTFTDTRITESKAIKPGALATISVDDLKSGDAGDKLIKAVFSGANAWQVISGDPSTKTNPLVMIKSAGDQFMYMAQAAWATKFALEIGTAIGGGVAMGNFFSDKVGGSASWAGILQAINTNFSMPIMIAIFSVFVFGATLAIYIPMIPYLYWIFGIAGWLIVVIEAVVAAPLWAMMHMHPAGDGVAGDHAQRGYMLVLEVFMRPTMMVIGLVFATLLMYPLTFLVYTTFFKYADSTQVDSLYGLFTWLFMAAIFAGLLTVIMHKTFSLIHVIPEKVMEWIGGHNRPDNPEGSDQQSRGVFVGAASVGNKIMIGEGRSPGGKPPAGPGGGGGTKGAGGADSASALPNAGGANVSSASPVEPLPRM